MSAVSLSGAGGFLGWHTRSAAHAQGTESSTVALGGDFDVASAAAEISGTDRFIHIAGVNRGTDEEVRDGNIRLAQRAADALVHAAQPPATVVFANSIQSGNGTVYGEAKAAAADILRAAADRVGARFTDERLPNLFGEHGRPFYNSVVATFAHQLAEGAQPRVDQDRELSLLHGQNAADLLLGTSSGDDADRLLMRETVTGLLARLTGMAEIYAERGAVPDLSDPFDRDLFNTYRASAFESTAPIRLDRHADERGSFFEIVRVNGGGGQTSFSTTAPGVTRGQHYHRRKVERFTVLSGEAVISLRRLFTDDVREFRVSSAAPASIDMPTMWAHNVTNVGDTPLYMAFWSNELFDPERPDTISEPV